MQAPVVADVVYNGYSRMTEILPDIAPTASFNDGRLQGSPTELPQRRSVRLPDYDYSQAGWYFLTIMAQGRQPVFGAINEGGKIKLSRAGEAVAACWLQLGQNYPQVHLDVWQLMPDHIHFILGLLPTSAKPKPLGQLVGAFKASATRRVRVVRPDLDTLWQRSYYDRIIRNAKELKEIRAYIQNNPHRWLER